MSNRTYQPERSIHIQPNNFPPLHSRDPSVHSVGSPDVPFVHSPRSAASTKHGQGGKETKGAKNMKLRMPQWRVPQWRAPKWKDIDYFLVEVLPRGWTIEVISSVISVAAFISIVVVLSQYNQHTNPSLPLGITLNTLLAFLTAVSQSCFLNPVIQGLSQMKWNWFVGRDRPLGDFEKFDNASRGSWGSILLVFNTKGRLSVLLASVILTTSAVTSTITQAVLTQSTRYIPGPGNATILRAINDSSTSYANVNEAVAMMMNAMFTRPNATYEFDTPLCSSGNCKYPSIGSLAVCSQSHDITDKLYTLVTDRKWCYQHIGDKWDWRTWGPDICNNYSYAALAPDIYLDYFGPTTLANSSNLQLDRSSTDGWEKMYSFERKDWVENSLNAVHTIYLDDRNSSWDNDKGGLPNTTEYLQHTHAVETLFYLCAQEYDVSITNGTTVTNVTSVLDYVTDTQPFEYTTDNYHYTLLYNRTFVLNGHNYSYVNVDGNIKELLLSFLNGKYMNESTSGIEYLTPFSMAIGYSLYQNSNVNWVTAANRSTQMFEALETMMNNTAKGMTNWIRSTGSVVQGQTEAVEIFVIVRWRFLIFLGVQITLSVCFLLWVMIDTKVRKTKIFKESALATLFTIPASDKTILEEQMAKTDEKDNRRKTDIEQSPNARLVHESGQWNLKLADQQE